MVTAQHDHVLVIAEDAALELAGYGHDYSPGSVEQMLRDLV
jgi:hypothetical protein